MGRPLFPPLSRKSDQFSRLQGVSRVYGRIGGSTAAITTAQVIMNAADGNPVPTTKYSDAWTIIDNVKIFGSSGTTGAGTRNDALGLNITQVFGGAGLVKHNFYSGTAVQSAVQYTAMDKIEWDTDGLLVIPPGYFMEVYASDSTMRHNVLVTGYKMSGSLARQLGLNAIVQGSARNGFASDGSALAASTANRLCIPGATGKAFRVKNILIRGGATAGTLEQVTIKFGNGTDFQTIHRVSTQRISLGHQVNIPINNCHITGPMPNANGAYGIYVQFSTTNAAFTVNVIGEYVSDPQQVDATGVFTAPATTLGKYFWCHTAGDQTTITGRKLFDPTILNINIGGTNFPKFYPLVDGMVMSGVCDGSGSGVVDVFGLHSGDANGGAIPNFPDNPILPVMGTDNTTVGFLNITTNELNMSLNDTGGIPCFDPRMCCFGYGANMDLLVWGRCYDRSQVPGGLSSIANNA